MRITDSILYRTGVSDTQAQRQRLADVQEQASSGLRINRPSDDPVGVRAATLLKDGLALVEQYQRNLTRARARIGAVENALADSTDLVAKAKELALQGRTDTSGSEARALLATEVERLHEQLLSNANRRVGGAYIFAGYASDTQPFTASGPFQEGVVPGPDVGFGASASEVSVPIDDGVEVQVTLDGRRVFQGDGDGDGSPDAGRVDLFGMVRDLRDALLQGDTAGLDQVIGDAEVAINQLQRERTRIGAADAKADLWEDRLAEQDVELRRQLSLVEDADSIEVFSELVKREAALQASLESTARLLQPSLLDFLG